MIVEPFRPEHLNSLVVAPAQRADYDAIVSAGYGATLASGLAWSGFINSRCIGCAGILRLTRHKGVAWALMSDRLSSARFAAVRACRRAIRIAGMARVEIHVVEGHEAGHAFARAMGAVLETPEPMRYHGFNGRSEYLYAVITE